jgi:glycosyltransferase involved in cell wall biosynthesis
LNNTEYREKFCCAIVPARNNAQTLEKVLFDVARYLPYVIVVNDGSTDHTASLLDNLQVNGAIVDVIHLPANRGKGNALQKGFERAVAAGFRYAVTIDADGQHFADDIPLFIAMIQKYPDSLIVGARNMRQDGVPAKSGFGNRFSNFWFRVETGIKLPDTQSGFRLYPLERVGDMRFFTHKYEFEIEVLVRVAWLGCRIRHVPIQVYYAPEESRVSHFRPFRDFARISLLNTVLVSVALLWMRPRNWIRNLNRQKIKRFYRQQLFSPSHSALYIASSAGFGIFIGILPIWGYQLIVGIALAHFLKLNKAIVFVTANISLPPMIPAILYVSFLTGGWIVGDAPASVSLSDINFDFVKHHFYQYLVGSVVFAAAAGMAVTLLAWMTVLIMRRK